MGDENQINPNINTTPVQRHVSDGYPSGKAVPLRLQCPGFKPHCRQYAGLHAGPGGCYEKIFVFVHFAFFFLLCLCPLCSYVIFVRACVCHAGTPGGASERHAGALSLASVRYAGTL